MGGGEIGLMQEMRWQRQSYPSAAFKASEPPGIGFCTATGRHDLFDRMVEEQGVWHTPYPAISIEEVGHRLKLLRAPELQPHVGATHEAHLPLARATAKQHRHLPPLCTEILLPQRWLDVLPPARLLYDSAQDGSMRQPHTGGLLEQEGVLLHPRDRVKIGKPQLPVLQHPAIKTRKIVHAKERKELLRLYLDAFDNLVRKARRTVKRHLAGREVFAAIVKNLMRLVILLDLCRYDCHRQPKAIFQHNHREFN